MPGPAVTDDPTFVLIDARADAALWFAKPERILTARVLDDVAPALLAAEEEADAGAHVAGYLAYEAGFAFEPKLHARAPTRAPLPLVWFGVFASPERLDLATALDRLGDPRSVPADAARVDDLDMDPAAYNRAFDAVRDHLSRGDIYQANLTMRGRGQLTGRPADLFRRLVIAQPVGHAAFFTVDGHTVLSLSPELFLEKRGTRLRTKPMKGTAPRGPTHAADQALAHSLRADPKSRAENVMIVDLMRNDLSRIAETGTVDVPRLFDVEPYRTLFQMTSTVEATLAPGIGFAQSMARLFPCGSITGAPKLRAMEILHDLETRPRGIYTGAIGHLEPNGDFKFNVAIRTLVTDADGQFEIGTGSGLVFDSEAGQEYDEARLKLRFLERTLPDFDLFETIAWRPDDGYLLLERHIDRLRSSAERLGFLAPWQAISAALDARAQHWETARRVRLTLHAHGAFEIVDQPLAPTPDRWRVGIAPDLVDATDPLLRHKTTRRMLYDGTRAAMAAETGVDEVLFINRDGYVTEGSYTNLFVLRHGRLLTPALCHGLLPGTLRAALLDTGRAFEADLTLEDLGNGARIYFGNSVRGLVESDIQSRPSPPGR